MSKFELQDKIAIVTGGGGSVHGIGRGIALAYAPYNINIDR
jgi:NAD(P)-dependent dehydrogenase (short-subunit alcohol dehydrogenase family)